MPDIVELIDNLDRRLEITESLEVPISGIISSFQNIPGLVGFWPMSSVQRSTGNVYDLSGQGRTLTYNGNPIYNIYRDFVPYIAFDGTGDFLSRADETDLDILGTETIYDSTVRGLTMGGWFWFDVEAPAGTETVIGKRGLTLGSLSYWLRRRPSKLANFQMSTDGTALIDVDNSNIINANTWSFIVSRFTPSTELAIWVNATKDTNVTAVPASIFNSAEAFQISGDTAVAELHTGRSSLCFLAANAVPDALINALFQQSRVLFGV